MSTHVICTNNAGFEDQLTEGDKYRIRGVGENGFLLEADDLNKRWYGNIHFKFDHSDLEE